MAGRNPVFREEGFAVVFQVCNRGRFRIEGAVFDTAGGQPSAGLVAGGLAAITTRAAWVSCFAWRCSGRR